MKKYFLSVITIFVHTFVNNSKTIDLIEKIESEPKVNENQNSKIETDDSTNFVKKSQIHSATWYNMHGHKTASGERFHKDSLTAAYNYSKLGTYLRVTNLSSKLSVIVKVNDRMGYRGSNHIDLSKCAFDSIGNPNSGRMRVIIEEIK